MKQRGLKDLPLELAYGVVVGAVDDFPIRALFTRSFNVGSKAVGSFRRTMKR